MTSLIDANYWNAVQAFKFNTSESSTLPVTPKEALAIADKVADKIMAAFDMKSLLSGMAAQASGTAVRELSFLETCYYFVQNSDKSSKNSTVTRIQAATPLEKAILSQTIKIFEPKGVDLVKDLEIPEEVVKNRRPAILLFGIKMVHELANKIIQRATTSSTTSSKNEEKAPSTSV